MFRKITISTVAIVALMLSAFAFAGSAQADPTPTPAATAAPCSYANFIAANCAGQAGGYPENGFKPTATPTPRPTPKPTSSAVVSADTVQATGSTGGGGNAIAFTGAESRVLGYVGAGMIGFGAIALVAARRRTEVEAE